MNPIRRVPAIALLIVLALLPVQAMLDLGGRRVVVGDAADGLRSVTWTARLAPDGLLAVRLAYDLDDGEEHELSLRVPPGARHVTVDGLPVGLDNTRYATLTGRDEIVVAYELPGRVRRYADGAVLQLGALTEGTSEPSLDGDEGLFTCTWCYLDGVEFGEVPVRGALAVGEADRVDVRLQGLGGWRQTVDDGLIRFVGVTDSSATASLVALLPVGAVPTLEPVATGGSAAGEAGSAVAELDRVLDELQASGERFHPPTTGDVRAWVTLLLLVAVLAALAGWMGRRMARARADRQAARDDRPVLTGVDGVFSKPSDLEPALVGMVVGTSGAGDRSVVAGTLLSLAHRGIVSIDGIDSTRFHLTVPAGATGETVFEEAVLARLRPQGQVSATAILTGPPLWGDDGDRIARSLAGVLAKESVRAGLTRTTLSALVLVPASVAMGVIALVGSRGLSTLGWVAATAGPLLAVVASIASGFTLTARGREERRRWSEYAEWLRDDTRLEHVGAPGVHTWGEILPHAAVVGAAPVAAAALSPRHGGEHSV